jgi:hypothetical protein
VSTIHCEFMIIDFSPELQFGDGTIMSGQVAFGMYSRGNIVGNGVFNRCLPWIGLAPDFIWDSAYKAAVIFGFFANISVGIGFLMSIFLVCFPRKGSIQITGLLFGLGFLWHILMFVAFAYDVCNSRACKFSSAAAVNVVATFMTIVTTIVVLSIQPSDVQDARAPVAIPENSKMTNIQETIHADGTKTIRKETTNADGSKVVEETKIEVRVADP